MGRGAKGEILQERGEGEGIKERDKQCVVCVYVYFASPAIHSNNNSFPSHQNTLDLRNQPQK